jgi:hypothetical protein
MTRRSLSLAILAALTLLPSVALACPVCGADQNTQTLKIVAVFLAVPFVLAIVVIPMIVRAVRQSP